jgi:hypothetical protein
MYPTTPTGGLVALPGPSENECAIAGGPCPDIHRQSRRSDVIRFGNKTQSNLSCHVALVRNDSTVLCVQIRGHLTSPPKLHPEGSRDRALASSSAASRAAHIRQPHSATGQPARPEWDGQSDRTRPSWVRDSMPSSMNTFFRWYWTVRALRNNRAPISGLDRPSRAIRAIWASCAVS